MVDRSPLCICNSRASIVTRAGCVAVVCCLLSVVCCPSVLPQVPPSCRHGLRETNSHLHCSLQPALNSCCRLADAAPKASMYPGTCVLTPWLAFHRGELLVSVPTRFPLLLAAFLRIFHSGARPEMGGGLGMTHNAKSNELSSASLHHREPVILWLSSSTVVQLPKAIIGPFTYSGQFFSIKSESAHLCSFGVHTPAPHCPGYPSTSVVGSKSVQIEKMLQKKLFCQTITP